YFVILDINGVLLYVCIGAISLNIFSGRVQEDNLTKLLILTFTTLAIVLLLFTFLLQSFILAFVISFLFGAGTFGSTPILNSKMILAVPESPMLSGTIAASVFNIANFVGATFG